MSDDIFLNLIDKNGLLDKIDKLKSTPIQIKVEFKVGSVNEIKKQLQDGLNQSGIKLNNFTVSSAAIKSINNQITNGLMEKPIKINNIEIAGSATTRIRKSLEQSLNNISVNFKLRPQIGRGGSAGTSSSGTYLGPDIDGTPRKFDLKSEVDRITKELGRNLKINSSNASSQGFVKQDLDRLKDGITKTLADSVLKDVNLSLKNQSSNASSQGFISQSLSSAKEQIAKSLADSVAKDVGLSLKINNINSGGQQLSADQFKQIRAESVARQIALGNKISSSNAGFQGFVPQSLDEFKRHQDAARADLQQRVEDRGFFGHFSQNRFIHDESTRLGLDPSSINRRKFFSTSRLNDLDIQRQIGRTSAEALLFQGPLEAIGAGLGGAVGGSIAGTAGAAFGGPVGIAVAGIATASFKGLTEAVLEAAKAGLAYQRSVVAISGTLLESTQIVNAVTGKPLGNIEQLGIQRKRADDIQKASRSAAASVGIGGEAESNLVQSIITGAGSKGINLSAEDTATLTKRFGAAINLFAPDLINNPNFIRRDLTDILSGSGAASRTTLGSRLGPVLSQISPATNPQEILRATEPLEKLVFAFQNSGDAVTKIQLFGAQIEKLKQDFGKSFVDQLSPALSQINKVVTNPEFGKNLEAVAEGLGLLTGAALEFTVGVLPKLAQYGFGLNLGGGIAEDTADLAASSATRAKFKADKKLENIESDLNDSNFRDFIDSIRVGYGAETNLEDKDIKLTDFVENYTRDQKLTRTQISPLNALQAILKRESDTDLGKGTGASKIEIGRQLSNLRGLDAYNELSSRQRAFDNLSEGGLDTQNLRASSFGQSLEGQQAGIRSRFNGEGSFSDLIGLSETNIRGLEGDLVRLNNLQSRLTGQSAEINKDQISRVEGLIEKSQSFIQSQKDSRFNQVLASGSNAEQIASLSAQGISRVSAQDQKDALQAEIDTLRAGIQGRSNLDGLSESEKSQVDKLDNAARGRIGEKQAQQSLQDSQLLESSVNLAKTFNTLQASIEKLPKTYESLSIQLELNKRSLYEFDKQTEIASLQGQDKVIATLRNQAEKGGSLTAQQSQDLLTAVGGDYSKYSAIVGEAQFGDGINKELRDRNIATREADIAISELATLPGRRRNERNLIEQQQIDIKTALKNLDLDEISLKAQSVTVIGQLEQATGGDGSALAAAKKANPVAVADPKKVIDLTGAGGSRVVEPFSAPAPTVPVVAPGVGIHTYVSKKKALTKTVNSADEEVNIPTDGSGAPVDANISASRNKLGIITKLASVADKITGGKDETGYDKLIKSGNDHFNQIKSGTNVGKPFETAKDIKTPTTDINQSVKNLTESIDKFNQNFSVDKMSDAIAGAVDRKLSVGN